MQKKKSMPTLLIVGQQGTEFARLVGNDKRGH